MKKTIVIALSILFLASGSFAQKAKKSVVASTWSGYLVDKMCSKNMTEAKMPNHSKECLTEDHCSSSGYGLMTGGKWIAFDRKGNTLAANYLKSTAKASDIQVTVTGKMRGNRILVTSVKDKI
jgi:hypothetical protein